MTKNEFAIFLLTKHKETHRDVFDILVECMNDEEIPIFFDNVKKMLTDDIKMIIENELSNRNLIKDEYKKKGLFKILDMME